MGPTQPKDPKKAGQNWLSPEIPFLRLVTLTAACLVNKYGSIPCFYLLLSYMLYSVLTQFELPISEPTP